MDSSFAAETPAPGEPSAEEVAAMLGLVAADGFQATIAAQQRLLGQLLPALAAREELLSPACTAPPPAKLAPPRPGGPA